MTADATVRQTLDQRRAAHAWSAVQTVIASHVGKCGPDEVAKKFAGHARQMPVRVMTAGLGQTLAFIAAKKEAPMLLSALDDWVLVKRDRLDSDAAASEPKTLLERIIAGDAAFLRRATEEAQAYLLWLNRFVEAEGLTDDA